MKETIQTKVCTKCKQEKPIVAFYKDKTRKDNLSCWCGSCLVSTNNKQLKELKVEVLAHYSNGKSVCVKCGFGDVRALTIDHINGGGHKHRKLLGLSGNMFYRWLKRNGYPLGYRTLCMNCQFITASRRNN